MCYRICFITAAAGGEDEEYVPPKAEVQEVKEDDAFYTKRSVEQKKNICQSVI